VRREGEYRPPTDGGSLAVRGVHPPGDPEQPCACAAPGGIKGA
jgi:hypothetical protein